MAPRTKSRAFWLLALAGCSSLDATARLGGDAAAHEPPWEAGLLEGASEAGPLDGGADAANPISAADAGLGAPSIADSGPPSHGGTITFESIGATGWYPSVRDPATGPCNAGDASACCRAIQTITSDLLTPWDEELIVTLRGPMLVSQLAVYQPQSASSDAWSIVSSWSQGAPSTTMGIAFSGNGSESGFSGSVGTECLIDVSTSRVFPCGSGSTPYCATPSGGKHDYYGWSGSKLFVLLATMPHAPEVPGACSKTTTGGWYDAPWIGLSVGELVRAGAFSSCQCYAKDPSKGSLADGCGQFNVFEVVNDNNSYKNLDVFSTDMIDYSGYVGEGPCGAKCAVAGLSDAVDLIDKTSDTEAAQGAVSTPTKGPGVAFRRPEAGYRYFLILLDVPSRTVQLAMVNPAAVPASIAPLLPALPATVAGATVDALRALRLPR